MLYKIGDFSKETGVPIKTLRYYNEIDLFNPVEVDLFTGYRYYSSDQIEDLNLILKLKKVGFSLEEIKKYCEALHIVCEKMQNCKPKKEYYKSSIINDYYIELPYKELTINNGKAVYRRHGYSCSSKAKSKKTRSNYCLSLCRCNREEIEKFIEREIANDNLKVGGEDE